MSGFIPKRRISFQEFLLIPEAFFQLFVARLKVTLSASKQYIYPNSPTSLPQKNIIEPSVARIVSNVINGLALRTPWKSTCLVKVLAASKMLKKRNISHKIHFGIAKKNTNDLKAHAWLSVNNKVYIGGGNLQEFNEISSFTI